MCRNGRRGSAPQLSSTTNLDNHTLEAFYFAACHADARVKRAALRKLVVIKREALARMPANLQLARRATCEFATMPKVVSQQLARAAPRAGSARAE
jgi:hypothetical protein